MTDKDAAEPKKGSVLKFLLLLAFFAYVLRTFLVAPFMIPSGSMLPTMWVGDYLFVSKWPYGYSRYSFPLGIPDFEGRIFESLPERGDVAVFHSPVVEGRVVVKRVIGLPGDTVETRGGTLILNGEAVPRERLRDFALTISPNSPCKVVPGASQFVEPGPGETQICRYPAYRETLPNGKSYVVLDQAATPGDEAGPFTVPQGHVFLMGDNRDDSGDSRFAGAVGGLGPVPVENLMGRAEMNFWSTDGSASLLLPWTWFSALRGSRIGISY
ncbi:signal peptidase I [Sphingomicrobium lutaoense]|uniref:Signal peptidase I n=1 Tax=Sphingomicrobium lutaoense TaxID=515949 RepID=A0A839Z0D9_9SPHN|nr:signal peptidase I [Sphingomicrobium lutaoense]MBB3764028.1 signal peptidase I [Sphingomicrobium lutaoense]